MKKAYVILDFEGMACGFGRYEGEYAITHISAAKECSAIAHALAESGYEEIVINTPHVMPYLDLPAGLNIHIIHGEFNRCLICEGLDESFEISLLIGKHAMAGGKERGVNRHTVLPHPLTRHYSSVASVKINDLNVGEIGMFMAFAGSYNVPVIYLSGDDCACDEARELVPGIGTTAVKKSINYFCANSLLPDDAAKASAENLKETIKRKHEIAPFVINGPVTVSVSYHFPERAKDALGFVQRSYMVNENTVACDYASIADFRDNWGTIRGANEPDWLSDIGVDCVTGFFTRIGYEPYDPECRKPFPNLQY